MTVPDYETLVVPLGATWMSLARTRSIFERDVLPSHLARSRWFPERSASAITARAGRRYHSRRIRNFPAVAGDLRRHLSRTIRAIRDADPNPVGSARPPKTMTPKTSPPCGKARAKER